MRQTIEGGRREVRGAQGPAGRTFAAASHVAHTHLNATGVLRQHRQGTEEVAVAQNALHTAKGWVGKRRRNFGRGSVSSM